MTTADVTADSPTDMTTAQEAGVFRSLSVVNKGESVLPWNVSLYISGFNYFTYNMMSRKAIKKGIDE